MKIFTRPYRLFTTAFLLILILSLGVIFTFTPENKKPTDAAVPDSLLLSAEVNTVYGLPADSFDIIRGTIHKNVFLGDILERFDIPAKLISRIEEAAEGIFDFRKIRAGNHFAILKPKEGDTIPEYFVYEHTPTEYYLVNLTDSVTVEKKEKKTEIHHNTVSGVINSSLWNAMVDQQINPMVAVELSDIFAWSIDFFGLQEGDAFKIMYDELYVDSLSVGLGQIHGAWFRHADHEYTAIPFMQDGRQSFFDDQGNSLRKAFLKAPLKFSRVSSRFTGMRYHPILKKVTTHFGVDYAAPIGTPVHAIGDGMIISKGWAGGGGNMVKIRHNSIYTTGYMHLKAFAPGIHPGSYVKQGDLIGYVGSTGLSTGPHLDFRVWKNGSPINPLTMESPSVEPVKQENIQQFDSVRTLVIKQLDKIKLPGTDDHTRMVQWQDENKNNPRI